MTKIPDHTIGYYAIIVAHLDEFQGSYLVDDPALHKEAVKAQMMAMLVSGPSGIIGALQATMVEGYLTGQQHIVATAALALHGITKEKFFVIEATKVSGGTHTKSMPLKATTIDEAREEVNNLPSVKNIKSRLTSGVLKKKH